MSEEKYKLIPRTLLGFPTSARADSPIDLVGRVLDGRYRVVERVSSGAMGFVYRGVHTLLKRDVAIKMIRPDLEEREDVVRRFKREAKVIQQLTHPNTVTVYDFGETPDGHFYLVLEFLEGMTFAEAIDNWGALPAAMVERFACQILGSLIEAHGCGVIHRDVTPANLMLTQQLGTTDFVKLVDFGLARLLPWAGGSMITRVGSALGSPTYSSPEQLRGNAADERSDLYSLAHTLFELATGRPAFRGSIFEVAKCHMSAEEIVLPPILRDTTLGKVISRAGMTCPDDRYQTAAEMLADLQGERPGGVKPVAKRQQPAEDSRPSVHARVTHSAKATEPIDLEEVRAIWPDWRQLIWPVGVAFMLGGLLGVILAL